MINIRKSLFLMFFFIIFVGFVFSFEVPGSIKENCIIKEDKYIDTCPQYWQQLKQINENFFNLFNKEEQKVNTSKDLLLYVNKFLMKLHEIKKNLYISRKLDKKKIFLMDYMFYITNLYREIIQSKIDYQGSIKYLFDKTYYNQQQSGLVLQSVSLFDSSSLPQVYDDKITIKVSVRNFEQYSVSKVEDIYCFTSIGDEDYIFPLKGKGLVFPENSVTNIVGTLYIGDNTLTTIPGEKTMYCMMVYFDDNQKELTTPFVSFDFNVE